MNCSSSPFRPQRLHMNVPSSLAKPPALPSHPPHVALEIESLPLPAPPYTAQSLQPEAMPLPQRKRLLPKQISCTESYSGGGSEFEGGAAYARYFSRQNTSEDSANVTVSTVLAQSDSQSLHALPSYANTPTASAAGRLKSRSTSLLAPHPAHTPEAVTIPMEAEDDEEEHEVDDADQTGPPLPAQLVEKLHRMTSTSTGSSVAPLGCCSAAKSTLKPRIQQSFKPTLPTPSTGSDDEYRRRKRKYSKSTLSSSLLFLSVSLPIFLLP